MKISKDWHKWYSSRNGMKDPRYIPEDIYYSYIEPYYNRMELFQAYSDKTLYNSIFKDITKPETLIWNQSGVLYNQFQQIITLKEAWRFYLKTKS